MKANELMIGDWVMVNDVEYTHPLQVAEIFKKCGAYYATLYWDGMPDDVNPETLTADIDKVLPIPLTPEILEKNGFTQCEPQGYDLYVKNKEGAGLYRIFWQGESYKYYLEISAYVYPLGEFEKENIKYVHQLQHALRLCGIDKEIEL